jgi:two-component system NtrC family sensor kinase
MKAVSLRQPLMLSGLVFMLLVTFLVVALSSYALLNASRRAYRRATIRDLQELVGDRSPEQLRAMLQLHTGREIELSLVSADEAPPGLDLLGARQATALDAFQSVWVTTPISGAPEETYLAGRIDPSIPASIAFAEVSRMIPLLLLGALAGSGLIALFASRLFLPSLETLAEVARETRSVPGQELGLVPSDTPNEILEVAQRFRRTVRRLNEERDRAEAQRAELEQMQERLIRASKLASVGRLAAGIAHEIGNPLAAVQGYLSLLRLGLPEAEEKEVLERSVKELGRIHRTIKQLLAYARQGEEVSEPLAPFSTLEQIEEATTLMRGHPALRGVTLELADEASELGRLPDALGHGARLQQVLINLFLNAGQALQSQADRANPGRIVVRRRVGEQAVLLEVEDDGPGIPLDTLDAIFDPFFSTKAPGEGTGLGLAVSRALMEAMGGDLAVRPPSGHGACFTLQIPRAPRADAVP